MSEISNLNERLKQASEKRQTEVRKFMRVELENWSTALTASVSDGLRTTVSGIQRQLKQYHNQTSGMVQKMGRIWSLQWWGWLIVVGGVTLVSCVIALTTFLGVQLWLKNDMESLRQEIAALEENKKRFQQWGIGLYQDQTMRWISLPPGWRVQNLNNWQGRQTIILKWQ